MSDTNKPTEPQDQSQVQQAGTPTPRAARHGAVTSGTAPVPLTPQRISPPAAYFPRFAQMRAAGLRYGQPYKANPKPHLKYQI